MMDVYEKKGQDACVKGVYAKCFRHVSRAFEDTELPTMMVAAREWLYHTRNLLIVALKWTSHASRKYDLKSYSVQNVSIIYIL